MTWDWAVPGRTAGLALCARGGAVKPKVVQAHDGFAKFDLEHLEHLEFDIQNALQPTPTRYTVNIYYGT